MTQPLQRQVCQWYADYPNLTCPARVTALVFDLYGWLPVCAEHERTARDLGVGLVPLTEHQHHYKHPADADAP